jgi:hypothetical protein
MGSAAQGDGQASGGGDRAPLKTKRSSATPAPGKPSRAAKAANEAIYKSGPVDLDAPPAGLPALEFPASPERTDAEAKAASRRRRLRVELYGALALMITGMIGVIIFGIPQLLLLAALAIAMLVAYEFLVVNLQ